MKFQTGRLSTGAHKQITHMVDSASELKVKPSHRNNAKGWEKGEFTQCSKAEVLAFLQSDEKNLRIDVVADDDGEWIEFKAYSNHWADQYHGILKK